MVEEPPFNNLIVLELANVLAGPLVGQFCAELGARVIKVEPPGVGDPTRGWYLSSEAMDTDVTAYFSSANWGKESIAVDLSEDDGRALVQRLIKAVDVLVVGYKPGDELKFGVDYETAQRLNPGLIYLQVSAYGSQDPRPGFDAIIQAEAGFTFMNGMEDGDPVKMPVALMDLLAAHQLKEGLLLALLKKERSGRGSQLSTSLLGSATASLANQASNYLMTGAVPGRMGSEHPNIVPYGNIFLTEDGRQFVVAVGTERQFAQFAVALGLPELMEDQRFTSNAARVRHRAELNEILKNRILDIEAEQLRETLSDCRVPFGFVNDMAEVFEQSASRAQCFDGGRGVRTVALDGDIEGARSLSAPPGLDQHRRQILKWLDALES